MTWNTGVPDNGRHVLATYKNDLGKRRLVKAFYASEHRIEIDCEDDVAVYHAVDDKCFIIPGWYEVIENWDDFGFISITEGEVTHWMNQPDFPEE